MADYAIAIDVFTFEKNVAGEISYSIFLWIDLTEVFRPFPHAQSTLFGSRRVAVFSSRCSASAHRRLHESKRGARFNQRSKATTELRFHDLFLLNQT